MKTIIIIALSFVVAMGSIGGYFLYDSLQKEKDERKRLEQRAEGKKNFDRILREIRIERQLERIRENRP